MNKKIHNHSKIDKIMFRFSAIILRKNIYHNFIFVLSEVASQLVLNTFQSFLEINTGWEKILLNSFISCITQSYTFWLVLRSSINYFKLSISIFNKYFVFIFVYN